MTYNTNWGPIRRVLFNAFYKRWPNSTDQYCYGYKLRSNRVLLLVVVVAVLVINSVA